MIAALYVDSHGCYAGLEGVALWPESRDARLYAGPHRVVAHPPCARWCHLAACVEARYGYRRGDDGGTFAAALASVREFGGVLEHPAFSAAFARHGLALPRPDGWQRCIDGGWVTQVDQGRYGHIARKSTWLYAYGVSWLPSLDWREAPTTHRWGSRTNPRGPRATLGADPRPCVPRAQKAATPIPFRDVLIEIVRAA